MNKIDILWLSLDRVENKYSSTSFSLAKELAKTNRVFFIDNPLTLYESFQNQWFRIKARITKSTLLKDSAPLPDNFIPIRASVSWPINWLPKGRIYSLFSYFNNRIFRRAVLQVLDEYKIDEYIFVNLFNPFYGLLLPSTLEPKLRIYYSVDDIRHSPYVFKHGPILEEEMVKSYDLTLTTSKQLQKLLSRFSPEVYYLPNAANTSLFNTAIDGVFNKPKEIQNINNSIIIYTGHIDWRIDLDLLCEVARIHSDKTLLLVGPVSLNEASQQQISTIKNAVFTGSKKLEDLPAFLHFSNCAIIPFKCNTLTESIYPLKINEYLSAGLPVVATPFSEDMKQFEVVIALEKNTSQFAKRIEDSIRLDSPDLKVNRLHVAEKNSWVSRARQFWEILSTKLD